jgi:predicted Zn-dependent peptidase
MAHPYRNLIGWASEIESLRASEAEKFFKKYYVPGNITVAIVGDVNPADMKRLAEKYFASIPAGPLPPPVSIEEPPQEGEKRAALETEAQPLVMIGYKRPNQTAKDDPVFDVVSGVLSSGRTGLLYQELVRDKKIALEADSAASIPGGKYPNLFLFFGAPTPGHTTEEIEQGIYGILERLKTQKVDAETLTRVKTKLRAGLIQQLDSNTGLASQLTFYHIAYGNWRVMFTGLEDINKVSADDVQRVVRQYFVPHERTVAFTTAPSTPSQTTRTEGEKEAVR